MPANISPARPTPSCESPDGSGTAAAVSARSQTIFVKPVQVVRDHEHAQANNPKPAQHDLLAAADC
jgi:hypothetical protein